MTISTATLWPVMTRLPSENDAEDSGVVPVPSGPKNNRPSPVNEKCTPNAAISSTSTLEWAIGSKAMR